jgi:hypothetical protein
LGKTIVYTQSISPTNASTHHTQSISAHFKWWILIGKKYIVSHLFDAPHPINQSNPRNFFADFGLDRERCSGNLQHFFGLTGKRLSIFLKTYSAS